MRVEGQRSLAPLGLGLRPPPALLRHIQGGHSLWGFGQRVVKSASVLLSLLEGTNDQASFRPLNLVPVHLGFELNGQFKAIGKVDCLTRNRGSFKRRQGLFLTPHRF